MAINKNKTKEFIKGVDELFNLFAGNLSKETQDFIKKQIMGKAYDELKKTIDQSRPPVFFIVGRSGHGKSSLINALSGKHVAEIDDIKPCTPESTPYEISFSERYASWIVVDSRGIFESTTPNGAVAKDAEEVLKQDIIKYKPDIILHVISITEIRSMSQDLKSFKKIYSSVKDSIGVDIPTVVILNKSDIIGNPREWPPEQYPKKLGQIHDAMLLISEILKIDDKEYIDPLKPSSGFYINDDKYLGVIPICAIKNEEWNVETVSNFIGKYLPESAKLDFFQAQHKKEQLMRLSDSFINKFATIAGGIGAAPVPVADIAVLVPLQLTLVAIIGGLSCRDFSKEVAIEFLEAAGVNLIGGVGLKEVARQIVKLFPLGGNIISGGVASAGTYAIGTAAKYYYFNNELPSEKKLKRLTKDFSESELNDL